MAIRWSPLAVSNALDEVDQALEQARPFLGQAKASLKKASAVPNLPQYMDWRLSLVVRKLDSLNDVLNQVNEVRKTLPEEELKKDRAESVIKRPTLIG